MYLLSCLPGDLSAQKYTDWPDKRTGKGERMKNNQRLTAMFCGALCAAMTAVPVLADTEEQKYTNTDFAMDTVVSETLSILLSFDKGILPLKYSKMPQIPFLQHTTSKKKVQDVFFIININ